MTIRWGVVGTGGIAQRFATAFERCADAELVAIASRTTEAASAFGDRFGIRRRHRTVEDLAADPEVDVVHVATPNHRHHLDAIALLDGGKHVVCEKPFALDRERAVAVVECARRNDRFLMEGIWSRFLPASRVLADLLEARVIGEVRVVEASFGFAAQFMPTHRLFDAGLGGGSLLDVGIYPLQLCSMVLGSPDRIEAVGRVGETGVDEVLAMALRHPGGGLGSLMSAIRVNLRNDARIVGDLGSIELPAFMHCPDRVVVRTGDGTESVEAAFEGDGLRFQIDEVGRCLEDGRRESPSMRIDETLSLAATMDEVRSRLGVTYPEDGDR